MSEKVTCSECGAENLDSSRFCILCGHELILNQVKTEEVKTSGECKSCGVELLQDAKFCHSCGFAVSGEKQSGQKSKQIKNKVTEKPRNSGSFIPVLITVLSFIALGFILTSLASNEFDSVEPSSNSSANKSAAEGNAQHSHPTITANAETLSKIETLKSEINTSKEGANRQKASFELADIYIKLGRMLDAADIFIEYSGKNPKDEKVFVTIANLLDDGGEKQKAIEYYKKALELNPDNVDARVDMASIMISSESPMTAIAELKKALEINPNHQIANLNMGIMSYTVGKYDKAMEWFQKAKNIDPNSSAGKKAAEGITAIESINSKSKN